MGLEPAAVGFRSSYLLGKSLGLADISVTATPAAASRRHGIGSASRTRPNGRSIGRSRPGADAGAGQAEIEFPQPHPGGRACDLRASANSGDIFGLDVRRSSRLALWVLAPFGCGARRLNFRDFWALARTLPGTLLIEFHRWRKGSLAFGGA